MRAQTGAQIRLRDALKPVFGVHVMAGVAHTPYLEKRPCGYFFRRRLPTAWVEIMNPDQSFAVCLSLRTDVLSDAKILVARLTALTDAAFALTTERPVNHLKPEHVTLLTEMSRFQIAAHEAMRACAEPRSEAAANFAAQTERATQDMLRRALALGDRTPAVEPLREIARCMGVTLDETSADWRALAFEALRVMLDVSREREKRELGTYEDVTPVFRSVMASRAAFPAAAQPDRVAQAPVPMSAVPAIPSASVVPVGGPSKVLENKVVIAGYRPCNLICRAKKRSVPSWGERFGTNQAPLGCAEGINSSDLLCAQHDFCCTEIGGKPARVACAG